MKKTGDIIKFVIIEESSIAKGIRRVVALTGNSANDIQKSGNLFEERIELLENNNSKNLEGEIKICGKELDEASLSTIQKYSLKQRYILIKTKFDDAEKIRKAVEIKEVFIEFNITGY